jgi:hypothetical protein
LIGLGALIKKRFLAAVAERSKQKDSFEAFTANQIQHVAGWKAAVEAFEADSSKPNPYAIPKTGESRFDRYRTIMTSGTR